MNPARPTRRFLLRHLLYHRGGAFHHWFSRRIRPAGLGAIMVTAFTSFLCFGQPKNSIFQIFCFSLGLIVLALVWTLFRSAKVSAVIKLPKHSTVDDPLSYSIDIHNLTRRNLKGCRLLQIPPDSRPNLYEFSNTEEPGERERNIFDRTFAYYRWQWLNLVKRAFTSYETVLPFSINRGETKSIHMELTPHRRGVYPLDDLRILLPDPLGFFQKSRKISSSPARLVILPKRYPLPRLEMPGSATFRIGGEETSNSIGNSGEFVGLREYRPGDPMRQIHWKSWAHTGKPMVKELEDTFYPRYALVIDNFKSPQPSQVFEEIVSIASSFVVGLGNRNDVLLDLMFIADQAHTVTAGRGMERSEKLLEVLAGVKFEENDRFDLLANTVIKHHKNITSTLLIINGWDEHRKDLLKRIQSSGVVCTPLIVGNGNPPSSFPGYWIDSEHVSRDLLKLPERLSSAN